MNDISIKVDNISKLYQLGQFGTGTLSRDLNRWWAHILGKEDPYAKIGQLNDRTKKTESNFVWALKDISFEVKQGEVLGIIGRNGAGKSTLLKILSKITTPTSGKIYTKGRIASLLEVGTGFHPEMTGRENIFMNGAILGMRKREILQKLEEIVEFSGVEAYIDTPVKRYSSGMYVRLAFAVAAFLETEILIVDEVLAVGDAQFQKRCLGRMKQVSSNEGRTVLFVSHNMGAVRELCTNGVFILNGKIFKIGTAKDIINDYIAEPVKLDIKANQLSRFTNRRGHGEVRFMSIVINNNEKKIDPQKKIIIQFKAKVFSDIPRLDFVFMLKGYENSEYLSSSRFFEVSEFSLCAGVTISFEFIIEPNRMRTGFFPTYFWLGVKSDMAADNYPFDVLDSIYYLNIFSDKSAIELGYNAADPLGYFNLDSSLNNINIE